MLSLISLNDTHVLMYLFLHTRHHTKWLFSSSDFKIHCVSFLKKKFIYLAALGLSWGTRDLLVSAFKLSVAVCGIQFPEQGVVES